MNRHGNGRNVLERGLKVIKISTFFDFLLLKFGAGKNEQFCVFKLELRVLQKPSEREVFDGIEQFLHLIRNGVLNHGSIRSRGGMFSAES